MAEILKGIIERVTFHNPDNGFAVLRVKAAERRELVTVVGHMPEAIAGEYIDTGISAAKASRPALNRAHAGCRRTSISSGAVLQARPFWPECPQPIPVVSSAKLLRGAIHRCIAGYRYRSVESHL